jgi:hypothetical protein
MMASCEHGNKPEQPSASQDGFCSIELGFYVVKAIHVLFEI